MFAIPHVYRWECITIFVNDPWNWYKESYERVTSDLEAFSVKSSSKGKITEFRCKILGVGCRYDPKAGSGDCRYCNFALVHMTENSKTWRLDPKK